MPDFAKWSVRDKGFAIADVLDLQVSPAAAEPLLWSAQACLRFSRASDAEKRRQAAALQSGCAAVLANQFLFDAS